MKRVYSFRASGGGCRVTGRVLARDMSDATSQVMCGIHPYGQMNVNICELRNQARALKEWNKKQSSGEQGSVA